jgi:DNA sulfur modification protein DndD
MSFHFHKLHLKDWLVYGGQTEIEFSDYEEGQNIVTIHGQNGYGKTSLLRGLEFLFHDQLGRQEYLEHWHESAREEGEGSMAVALEFRYQGRTFKLIREIEFKPRGEQDKIYTYPNLELIDVEKGEIEDQAQEKIDLMIPKKSQQFVFFDGAEITRYAQKQHEEGVRDAIERMLGIPAIRNLGHDLGNLTDALEDKQAELNLAEGKSQELIQEIDDLKSERENYRDQKQDKKEKLDSIEQSAQELEKETAELSKIEAEQEQLKEKRERLRDYEDRRKEKKEQIDRVLSNAAMQMLKEPLTQIVQEGQAQQDGSPSRRRTYSQQKDFLESLLDESDCVCGRPMNEEAESKVRDEIERLANLVDQMKGSSSEGMFTFAELSSLSARVENLKDRDVDGEELFDSLSAIDDRIEEIETDIRRLERELEGHEDMDVRENMRLQRQLGEQASDLRSQIENLDQNIARTTKEIEERQRELDAVSAETEEGRRVTKTLQTSRNLGSAVDEFVERLVEEKREAIQSNASEIFQDITNKPDEYAGVNVNKDYSLSVYRHDGSVVENDRLSAGEKEVLAYSFITALNLSSPNPAPFVMDTPFGHLDSEHRDRLLQSLPRLDVQVFLLATDRDLPDHERDRIDHFIADEFVIERNQQEARSTIEAQ